jgi:hypothetical protein
VIVPHDIPARSTLCSGHGPALALTDAAEAIVLQAGDRYMDLASQYLTTAGELARVHVGLPDSLF